MSFPVQEIVTHHLPHFDEILAIELLRREGEKMFPGVSRAKISFLADGDLPKSKLWDEHLKEGRLLVGLGGGPFDEHSVITGEERKQGESAASLVAKFLGIARHPIYKRLVQLATEADQSGVHELHLASHIKRLYRLYHREPWRAIRFAQAFIEDLFEEQRAFLAAQRQVLQCKPPAAGTIKLADGREIKLVALQSNNWKIGAAARSLDFSVVIQQQPTGHVQIFFGKGREQFDSRRIVARLRVAELQRQGWSVEQINGLGDEYLGREGKIPEVPNWYRQMPGETLLNGSETTPKTQPTCLTLEEITEIVRTNLCLDNPTS